MMSEGSSSNDTGSRGGGRWSSMGQAEGLKKGPWTAAEDEILMEYVKVHGEGNWNAVQKNTGLMRCGKSCRLRWANHLRPNLKKGSFTPEEERIIIELHAKLGNKWARMASQLPGRTDNEIKNFWNTRIKRRQRAGLPIYTQENQEKVSSTHEFHFHQNPQDQQKHQNYNPNHNSPSYVPSLSLIDPITTNFSSSFESFYPNNINHTNINGLGFTLSPFYVQPYNRDITGHSSNIHKLPSDTTVAVSRAPSCSNLINNQSIESQSTPITPPSQTINYNNLDDLEGNNMISFTSLMMGATHVEPTYASSLHKLSPSRLMTPVSSNASGSIQSIVETSSKNMETSNENGVLLIQADTNSGWLDASVPDSKNHLQKRELDDENLSRMDKGKHLIDESITNLEPSKKVKLSPNNDNSCHHENMYSSQEQMGIKSNEEEQVEGIHPIDDDLMSLLNNFPSSMPLPEWYQRRTLMSNNSSATDQSTSIAIVVEDHNDNKNIDKEGHNSPLTSQITTTTTNHSAPNIDRCIWNNMPGIC